MTSMLKHVTLGCYHSVIGSIGYGTLYLNGRHSIPLYLSVTFWVSNFILYSTFSILDFIFFLLFINIIKFYFGWYSRTLQRIVIYFSFGLLLHNLGDIAILLCPLFFLINSYIWLWACLTQLYTSLHPCVCITNIHYVSNISSKSV